jgi:hypothetical protein
VPKTRISGRVWVDEVCPYEAACAAHSPINKNNFFMFPSAVKYEQGKGKVPERRREFPRRAKSSAKCDNPEN